MLAAQPSSTPSLMRRARSLYSGLSSPYFRLSHRSISTPGVISFTSERKGMLRAISSSRCPIANLLSVDFNADLRLHPALRPRYDRTVTSDSGDTGDSPVVARPQRRV